MIEVKNLSIGYQDRCVRSSINFSLEKGECVLLVGANGSGKSTLLKTLASLQRPLSGTVSFGGTVSMIPSRIPKVKGFSVEEFVRTGLYQSSNIFGKLDSPLESRMQSAASILGIEHIWPKDISQISDGEFQKACIASAVVRSSEIVLLDEPTAFLDVDGRISVLETLVDLCHEHGRTILFSSHDVLAARGKCDRILALLPDGSTELSDMTIENKSLLLHRCFPKLEI